MMDMRSGTPSDRIEMLEAENAQLREHIANLEREIIDTQPMPSEFGLTPHEADLVSALMKRQLLTKFGAMTALYRDFRKDEPGEQIVNVYLCRCRKKLAPFGIEIKTIWGRGYFLEAEAKKRIKAMMDPNRPMKGDDEPEIDPFDYALAVVETQEPATLSDEPRDEEE